MKFIALLFFFSAFANGIEPMDDYYANDLLEAVDQAKAKPHHYDYSNHYRYKRTTAQSINLNRLNLEELDETRLKASQSDQRISDDLVVANNQSDNSNASHSISQKHQDIKNVISLPTHSSYESTHGKFSTTGITGESILISTPRP